MNYGSVGKELVEDQVAEAKILFQKHSPEGAFKQSGPKRPEDARKKSAVECTV